MRGLPGTGQVVQADIPSPELHPVARLLHPHAAVDAQIYPVTLGITGPDQAIGSVRHDFGVRTPGHRLDDKLADVFNQ